MNRKALAAHPDSRSWVRAKSGERGDKPVLCDGHTILTKSTRAANQSGDSETTERLGGKGPTRASKQATQGSSRQPDELPSVQLELRSRYHGAVHLRSGGVGPSCLPPTRQSSLGASAVFALSPLALPGSTASTPTPVEAPARLANLTTELHLQRACVCVCHPGFTPIHAASGQSSHCLLPPLVPSVLLLSLYFQRLILNSSFSIRPLPRLQSRLPV